MTTAIVDSSVWIEIFGELKKSAICEAELKKYKKIIVPTIVVFEIQRKLTQMLGPEDALCAISFLSKYEISSLSREIAIDAAEISLLYRLGSADAIVLAHAHSQNADLITMDNDFSKIPNVVVLR